MQCKKKTLWAPISVPRKQKVINVVIFVYIPCIFYDISHCTCEKSQEGKSVCLVRPRKLSQPNAIV